MINGVAYDLWRNYNNWDLEQHGGVARYTYSGFCDFTNETWYSNYYLVKQGVAPGESGNALDMTGKIPDIERTVYVFFGEVFLNQTDASASDNDGRRAKQREFLDARERTLAARESSVK
jgi:hypothetical protein